LDEHAPLNPNEYRRKALPRGVGEEAARSGQELPMVMVATAAEELVVVAEEAVMDVIEATAPRFVSPRLHPL